MVHPLTQSLWVRLSTAWNEVFMRWTLVARLCCHMSMTVVNSHRINHLHIYYTTIRCIRRTKLYVLWDINDIGHTMWTPYCLKWWWGLIISGGGGGGGSVILQWAKWICIWDHSTTTATCRTIASQKSIYNSGRVHTLSVTQWRRAPGKSTDTL